MKQFCILLIDIYQKFISPSIKMLLGIRASCRFNPTCSEYMKKNIVKHGIIKGGYVSFSRLLKCQPYL